MPQASGLRRRISPSVPFTLRVENPDETFELSFRLAYNLNAFGLIETELKLSNLFAYLGELLDSPGAHVLRVLFWAALQENHPEYAGAEGLAAIGNLLSIGDYKAAHEACVEAFLVALPKEQGDRLRALIEKIKAAMAKGEKVPEPQVPTQGPAEPAANQ